MKKNIMSWRNFAKSPPPVGVPIVLRLNGTVEDRPVMLHSVELGRNILPCHFLEFSRFGRRTLRQYFTVHYPESTQWRFASGRVPSAQLIEAGRRRVARILAKERAASKLEADRAARQRARQVAAQKREMALPVWRIRRVSSAGNGSANYYHHADVRAATRHEAIRAAREGRVQNWRWIDTFDSSDTAYLEFEYLYKLDPDQAEKAAVPLTHAPATWKDRPRPLPYRRYLANGRTYGALQAA